MDIVAKNKTPKETCLFLWLVSVVSVACFCCFFLLLVSVACFSSTESVAVYLHLVIPLASLTQPLFLFRHVSKETVKKTEEWISFIRDVECDRKWITFDCRY